MSELAVGSIAGLASNNFVVDVASGSSLDLSNGATLPAGSIIQVVSTTKTDVFSTSSTSFVNVTGLSASITPSSASSKIYVVAYLNFGHSVADNFIGFNLNRDGVAIAQPSSGSDPATLSTGSSTTAQQRTGTISFLDDPEKTSAVVYDIQVRTSSGTMYLNRPGDSSFSDRHAVSSITLLEVAG